MPEPRPWLPFALHGGAVIVVLGTAQGLGYGVDVMQANGWWWPFWIVQGGILSGLALASRQAQVPSEASALQREGRREDLSDAHATIVAQLRALEVERDKLTPEDYERERAHLVAVGASVLRELDQGPTVESAPADPAVADLLTQLRALRTANPTAFDGALGQLGVAPSAAALSAAAWRGAGWTTAVVGVLGVLALYATEGSRARGAGESMTGGDQVMGDRASAEPRVDPRIEELQAKIAANPQDIEALNRLTEIAIASEDLDLAMQTNASALAAAPQDVDARTFKAVLKAFIGRKPEALTELDQLIADAGPQGRALRPLVYVGLLTMESEPTRAVAALEQAYRLEANPQILGALQEARRRAAGGSAPPNAQAAPAAPPSAPPSAGGGDPNEVLASGTITLADAARAEGKRVLFVNLKDPAGGPPLAAVKLPPGPFPMAFQITRANLVGMGGARPLPAAVTLSARLDEDGDPMSKPPTDPAASVEGFAVGTQGAALALQ
jgi:hypothetical protein